jgi:hypothetical protein
MKKFKKRNTDKNKLLIVLNSLYNLIDFFLHNNLSIFISK